MSEKRGKMRKYPCDRFTSDQESILTRIYNFPYLIPYANFSAVGVQRKGNMESHFAQLKRGRDLFHFLLNINQTQYKGGAAVPQGEPAMAVVELVFASFDLSWSSMS